MIMHGQVTDWITFLQSNGQWDGYDCDQCQFINCRLLKMKPPVLLPTSSLCFIYSMKKEGNSRMIRDLLVPIHPIPPIHKKDYYVSSIHSDFHSIAYNLPNTTPYSCLYTDYSTITASQPSLRGITLVSQNISKHSTAVVQSSFSLPKLWV